MKQLLGMARQKKGAQPQIKKPIQPQPQQLNQYDDEDYQNYQPSQQQLLGYAQYIGIKIPQQLDMLHIAKQGIVAPLPPDWEAIQTDNDQVFYYNNRTGQKTQEHPCDQYYKQLVIRQRKKKQNKSFQNPTGVGIGQLNHGLNLNLNNRAPQIVQPPIDPLVKLQQQKKLKKLEQHKRQQFQTKKKDLIKKFEDKKEKLQKDNKNQQQKMKNKYDQEESNQRKKIIKKVSQKQRQSKDKNQQILNQFEKQTKKKLQKQFNDKKALQKDKIQRRIKQKKQQIRIKLQNQLKKSKRQIDQQYEFKLRQLQNKQKSLVKQGQEQSLQNKIQKLKQQIVRKKMKEHSQLLHQQRKKQEANYQSQIKNIIQRHQQKIASLQTSNKPNSLNQKSSIEELIKQIENQQKIKMKELKCQLEVLRELKRVQNQQKIQKIKAECQQIASQKLKIVMNQYEKLKQKFKQKRYQQYQQQLWQAQKRAKQDYLRTLKTLQEKYQIQQEIAHSQSNTKASELKDLQLHSISAMERMIDNLNWDEKQLRKQLQNIQDQVEKLKSNQEGLTGKLSDHQMQLFKLIQGKIRSNTRNQH